MFHVEHLLVLAACCSEPPPSPPPSEPPPASTVQGGAAPVERSLDVGAAAYTVEVDTTTKLADQLVAATGRDVDSPFTPAQWADLLARPAPALRTAAPAPVAGKAKVRLVRHGFSGSVTLPSAVDDLNDALLAAGLRPATPHELVAFARTADVLAIGADALVATGQVLNGNSLLVVEVLDKEPDRVFFSFDPTDRFASLALAVDAAP